MHINEDCIAIYSRKSKFTGKGESIGNQVELCKEYIRTHCGADSAEHIIIYEDEGFSGGNLNRPDFKKMMKAAKSGKFSTIVVYRLDRISRNISDFSGLIEELSRLNIAFISIKEQFDTGTPMGRAMMYIASVFSQLERETIAERIRDNMHELAKTGRWLGGTTPTGYASESVTSISVDGKPHKACKLKLIPTEAENVKTIYDLFTENESLTMTEAELMRRRIVSKNNKYYTRFSIKSILQNPVYLIADQQAYDYFIAQNTDLFSSREEFNGQHGILAYNRTDQAKGKSTVYLPVAQWIISVGQHPGIIPGRVWVRVQEVLERNRSKSVRSPRSNEALLSGLLYCSCGSRMYPKLSKRTASDGTFLYTYVCKMKERSQRSLCSCRNLNGNTVDQAVMEHLESLEEDRETLLSHLEQKSKLCISNLSRNEDRLDDLHRQKSAAEEKIKSLVDSLAELSNSNARAPVAKRIEQLNDEIQSIEIQIQKLEKNTTPQYLSDTKMNTLGQQLSDLKTCIGMIPVMQKRMILRNLIQKVVWDGIHAHVILSCTNSEDLS